MTCLGSTLMFQCKYVINTFFCAVSVLLYHWLQSGKYVRPETFQPNDMVVENGH